MYDECGLEVILYGLTQFKCTKCKELRSLYMNYASEKANNVLCHGIVQMFSELPRERKKNQISPKNRTESNRLACNWNGTLRSLR